MAKGGRNLNTNKKEKKKGKAGKIVLTVFLVLVLLVGGGVFAVKQFMGSMLGNIKRAEFVEGNQDKSYDDLMAEMYENMDLSGSDEEEYEDEVPVLPESQTEESIETESTAE